MAAKLSKRTKILLLIRRRLIAKNKYKKRFWVRKIFTERKQKGEYHLLVQELRLHDQEYFFKYFRMTPSKFEVLLRMVAPFITKSSFKREAICPSERLAVTLRYLVTGDSQTTIALSYRIGITTVGKIINETTEVIWKVLNKEYVKFPKSEREWKHVALNFEKQWNFNNCIGAVDGKHVVMQAPSRSGSYFYNYKNTHSIVLLGVYNADYEFIMVDIGDCGRNSDGGVYSNSNLGYSLDPNLLKIPPAEVLNGTNLLFPYVLVADDAFQLKNHIMKPYPKEEVLGLKERIFNYRLCRTRRIIENTFGIASARFKIFRSPIIANVSTVINVTKAVVSLHNFLMKDRTSLRYSYCPVDFIDRELFSRTQRGQWRNEIEGDTGLIPIRRTGSNNYSRDAKILRDQFRDYFCSSAGEVPWQWNIVQSTHNSFDEL